MVISSIPKALTSGCYPKPHGGLGRKSTRLEQKHLPWVRTVSKKSKHKMFSDSLIKKTQLLSTLSTQGRKCIFMKAESQN